MATDIEYLGPGWRWVAKGKQEWTTSQNKSSTARHAIGPGGQTLSVRQVQNKQRERRAEIGQPKAAAIPRQGRTKRMKGPPGTQTNVTRSKTQQTGVGSLYNENVRGRIETWVFRSFDDARNYVISGGDIPSWARFGILKTRYSKRLRSTDLVGSDKVGQSNGYASLTGFRDSAEIHDDAINSGEDASGKNFWVNAEERLENYDVNGSRARFYLQWQEK